MNLLLSSILGGVGQGVGQAGTAIAGARKDAEDKAIRDRQLGFQERQVNLQEQAAANERSDRDTLATTAAGNPSLAEFAPLLKVKGGDALVKILSENAAKDRERTREAGERDALTKFIMRSEGTPDTIQRPGAMDLEQNPEAAGTSGLVPGQAPLDRTQRLAGLSSFKTVAPALYDRLVPKEDDKFMSAGPETDIINPRTGEVVRKGTPKPKEPNPGQEYVTAVNTLEQAEAAFHAQPTPQNKQAVSLASTRVDRLKPIPFQYGGGISGPSGAPPIVKPEAPPVSADTATTVVAAGAARQAAQGALKALDDPIVNSYLGPYAQYKSEGQRRTPFQLAGDVPPAVVDLEQNNAKVKNYTIRLITGAAVRKDEEGRIVSEIVDTRYPPKEYRQRMQRTLENIDYLEQRVRDLALRGDQKALAVANEAGLLGGANGKPQGRISVIAPDGTPGTWDASRGPIPPGYRKR